MHSALKRDGRPFYELAREGLTVERAARNVTIMALELLSFGGDSFRMRVRCSKGTYIRTLAEDLFAAVGQRAHLGGLRRPAVTHFRDHQPVRLARLPEFSGHFAALDGFLFRPGQE